MTTEKKKKKERAKGEPQPAIKWFQERAGETQDIGSITDQAKKEKYSDSTISIQLGRLRGMGLLPAKEVGGNVEKPRRKKAAKTSGSAVRAVPKPSQKRKATSAAKELEEAI